MKEDGPPMSNKMTMEMYFFFKALPEQICFKTSQITETILMYIMCKFQVNLFRQSLKKTNISMVILFDVVGCMCDITDAIVCWRGRLSNTILS